MDRPPYNDPVRRIGRVVVYVQAALTATIFLAALLSR